MDVEITKVDEENEIFYSSSGLISKTFNENDIKEIAQKAGLKVKETKILGGVVLWTEIVK